MLYSAINDSNGYTQADLAYFQGANQNSTAQAEGQGASYQVSQKFYVGRGNNDPLVRSVLKQRSWWNQYIPPSGTYLSAQNEDEAAGEVSLLWTSWKR
jgi:hypothetical protein